MTISIKDLRVLVVGASGGIGGAVADAFTAGGAEVARPARSELDFASDVSV